MSAKVIKTPCIGICSTVYGDTVCRGCKRFANEVIDWNRYQQSEKQAVIDRLEALQCQILEHRICRLERDKLLDALKAYRIPCREEGSVWVSVFQLLRLRGAQMEDTARYGIHFDKRYTDYTPKQLYELLEEEYLQLSIAHCQRYFAAGASANEDLVIDQQGESDPCAADTV